MNISDHKQTLTEIKQDPIAYQRLQNKARWEQMTLLAVLAEWGDPRGWPND